MVPRRVVGGSLDGRSQTFPFATQRLPLVDGTVAYFDHGEGPAVVFVHGLVGDFTHFEHVAVRLADAGYRVIGLDLPGCGESHKRRTHHSIGSYARDVLALLDALGIAEVSLVGHSAGGAVVAEVAHRAPKRVKRLGLLASAGLRRYPRGLGSLARVTLRPWLLERTLERLALPLLDMVLVEQNEYTRKFVADALNRPSQPGSAEMARVMADLVPELVRPTVLDRAPRFELPVLVLWGDADGLVPPSSVTELQNTLRKPTFVELKGCGHMPMIEQPELTTKALLSFLEPVSQPGRQGRAA